MTEELKKLIAERDALLAKAEGALKGPDGLEKRVLEPEDQANFDALMAQVADLETRIKALEDAMNADMVAEENARKAAEEARAKLAKATARKVPPGFGIVTDLNDKRATRDRDLALRAWFLGKEATSEMLDAAHRSGLDLRKDLVVPTGKQAEFRAQSTSGSAGGYSVPQGFIAELETKRLAFNTLRGVARVLSTSDGRPLPLPTMDDTSNTGALFSENTATSATDATLGQKTFGAYTYKSRVDVSLELLQDTGLDFAGLIGELCGERLGRSEAAAAATGTGSSQPEGVTIGCSAGKTTASATAITINELLDLINSLDAAYQPGASLMLHQTVWTYLCKLQDSLGRQLIQPNLADPTKPTFNGYPVIINNQMNSAITTGLITALFGDFSKFWIRDAGPITVRRSDEFLFSSNAASFLAVSRFDSKVVQSAAIKKLTQA